MTDLNTQDAALVVFNSSRAFYGLPAVAEIPAPRPDLTVVPS